MVRTPGEQLGDYRLVRMLGEGGFAEVYEADHVHLPGVKAAIKLLKGSFSSRQIEELRQEALMVSKLDHPHIVSLRTFSIEHTIPYLVMAYAQGGALNRRYPRGTCMELPQILSYVRPVAAALQYAHEQKIVHRDLKPANLLLTQDGRVQVADFGIAVVSHSSSSRTFQEIVGTWVYMAPEQFRGLTKPASDQYSLAIMVYQWLCGNVPFDGNGNMYLIPEQQKKEVPPSLRVKLPDLFPDIEEVVMKALAKDPKERFASIQAFADALEEASRPPFVPTPGQYLGDYRLVRKLGEGGFAEVYEAEHLHLGTKAAIKLLKGTFTPAQVEGLRQEARAIIQLDHPHIIRAYGFSLEGKTPYLIMAYAPEGSLATRHEQRRPLPLETIREYVRQIAAALQSAHDQKITHRDIKPENILLIQDERLQIADFGIAIMAQTAQTAQEIVGSWTYMAPEQFTGKAEPASDQYALGVMVYEWLCGEPPFTGNGSIYALPYQQMNEPPPSLCDRVPALSPRIEQVVMRALAKQPGERWTSVSAFAQALEEACTTPAVGTTLFTYEHLGVGANTVAWSPDGTRIASGGEDATVRIWDTATGQALFTLRGHTDWVRAVAWSPDGELLASADKTVQIWEARTGKLLQRHQSHTELVYVVAWSSDGRLLVSASCDKTVQVWEVEAGKMLQMYRSHTEPVWSPDGQRLAFALDNMVQVWEARTARLLQRYEGHTYSVWAVAWSPDGHLLASASTDRTVQVWEAGTGKPLQRYEGHASWVNAVSWSPDGHLLASVSNDKTIQVWEARTGKLVLRYAGHTALVNTAVWSPDGTLLASAFFDGPDPVASFTLEDTNKVVHVWEARTGRLLLRHESKVVRWSPHGQKLALTWYNQGVQVWEARAGKLLQQFAGHASWVSAVDWSRYGHLLASASTDRTGQVRETRTGNLLQQYVGHGSSGKSAVAWSPDGELVALTSHDEIVHVWGARTGRLVQQYVGHGFGGGQVVAWSPDGELVASASASSENKVHVWEARTGKLVQQYAGHNYVGSHNSGVYTVAWSPDGRLLASASDDKTVHVWEARTGKLLQRYAGHASWVWAVAWSPNERLLVSASEDKTVHVWEARTGKLLQWYEGHTDRVNAVSWSPDGRLVASASRDKTVQVWEVSTGRVLLTYRGHFTGVEDVAWSPDGKQMASSGYEVQVWMAPY